MQQYDRVPLCCARGRAVQLLTFAVQAHSLAKQPPGRFVWPMVVVVMVVAVTSVVLLPLLLSLLLLLFVAVAVVALVVVVVVAAVVVFVIVFVVVVAVVVVVVVFVFTLSRCIYPTSAVHPVSVLIIHPREILFMWSHTETENQSNRKRNQHIFFSFDILFPLEILQSYDSAIHVGGTDNHDYVVDI